MLQVLLLGDQLKSLLVVRDELCDKLFTADWVTEGKTGNFPEYGNIPDDVKAAMFLARINAANPMVAFMNGLQFPKGNPKAPNDGNMGFLWKTDGNKMFDVLIDSKVL